MVGCEPEEAQFVLGKNDEIYRVAWLNPAPPEAGQYELADVAIITRQEYDDLKAQLDDGETPAEPQPVTPEPEPEPEPTPGPEQPEPEKPMTVQQMRAKIAELEEMLDIIMGVIE